MPAIPHELALPPRTRVTPQRQAVLDAIAVAEGGFTLVELYDRARIAAPTAAELRRKHGFRAETHQVDIYGTCGRCAA